MDFLDPKKQRQHMIQLLVGYVLVAIAILLATTLLIMYAYGFRLSRDGQLNQLGLLFVSSQPTGGDVYVNDKLEDTTNAKLNLVAGRYDLKIVREGYNDWERNFVVEGGEVDHYVYPLLIPTELSQTAVTEFATRPSVATQSPDKRWLVVQSAADSFAAYDLNRSQTTIAQTAPLVPPTTIFTASETAATWEVVEWADNNRHILMQRTYALEGSDEEVQKEYILLDRTRPAESRNITRELSLAAGVELSLHDKKSDLYYLFNEAEGTLARASLSNPEAELVRNNVLAFKSHGRDMLLYATPLDSDERLIRTVLLESEDEYTIRIVPRSDLYLLDLARYSGDWYVVVGSQAENRVYLHQNPVTSIRGNVSERPSASFAFNVDTPRHVSFSANAQFVAVQSAGAIHVYDSENIRAYRYDVPYELDAPQEYIRWMDGYRFSYVSNNQQVMFEYDNINLHQLAPSTAALGGFYDNNNRYLYTFVPAAEGTGYTLAATALRTEADL